MGLKIGIIGGSGLENPELLQNYKEIDVDTPFGKPSSPLITGRIHGIEVVILSRHGKKHEIPPTQVNNRANIFALKYQGCKYIISTTAVGSLRDEIKRGDFIILDQFIDFTKHREITFYDKFDFGPIHTAMANPFSENIRKKLIQACESLKFNHYKSGTVITVEGPRFSTIAESNMFRQWGADVINMSISPEAILAKEAEVEYATIAMSTDYDCWKQDETPVSWDAIKEIMKNNNSRVQQVLLKTIEYFSLEHELEVLKSKIREVPDYPKQGISFKDLTTLMKDPEAFKKVVDILYNRYKDENIDVVAGIESRGFIIGGILAERLGLGFVPIRKKGKLPSETIKQDYDLEYGTDTIEIHKDAILPGQNVLIIDDLIATGGTALASCNLVEKLGGKVFECGFIVELKELEGRDKIERKNKRVFSLIKYDK